MPIYFKLPVRAYRGGRNCHGSGVFETAMLRWAGSVVVFFFAGVEIMRKIGSRT